jgi:hypothetical protein
MPSGTILVDVATPAGEQRCCKRGRRRMVSGLIWTAGYPG